MPYPCAWSLSSSVGSISCSFCISISDTSIFATNKACIGFVCCFCQFFFAQQSVSFSILAIVDCMMLVPIFVLADIVCMMDIGMCFPSTRSRTAHEILDTTICADPPSPDIQSVFPLETTTSLLSKYPNT